MVGEVEGFGVDVCSQIRAQAADNLRDEAYHFLLWGAGARVLALQLLQRFRLLQVSRVKALGEPVVDLCQQLVGCLPLALLLPQATVSRVASRPGVADAVVISMSWLQVFRSTKTAHLGPRRGHERQSSVVPSEKYAACRGSVSDGRRMITACLVRALQSCMSRIGVHFPLTFQTIIPIRKTRNQLYEELSWGMGRKCTGMLAEIKYRKSQEILLVAIFCIYVFPMPAPICRRHSYTFWHGLYY
jgi:hypothetical protein